jgi:integrase
MSGLSAPLALQTERWLNAGGITLEPDILAETQMLVEDGHAPNTRLVYANGARRFIDFCDGGNICALPAHPKAVTHYLGYLSLNAYALGTAKIHVSAINALHNYAEAVSPTRTWLVAQALRGYARKFGRQARAAAALMPEDLIAIYERFIANTATLRAARDWAVLETGFAGALRRSELVGMEVENLALEANGYFLHLPYSKTDQFRLGEDLYIGRGVYKDTDPVGALEHWLKLSGITSGPVFRAIDGRDRMTDRPMRPATVGDIVKRYVKRIGLDPALFSAHSLRAGWVTSAIEAGAPIEQLRKHSRHRQYKNVLTYIRHRYAYVSNWSAVVGL